MNLLKPLFLSLTLFLLIIGCASNQPTLEETYPNLVKENPPERIPYIEKEVTTDSISFIRVQRQKTLLIEGTFPNPCTQILRVDERTVPEILYIDIIGWQRYQQSCAETITPFTYVHKGISAEQWANMKLIVINGIEFELPLGSNN